MLSACLPPIESRECRNDSDCPGAACVDKTCVTLEPARDGGPVDRGVGDSDVFIGDAFEDAEGSPDVDASDIDPSRDVDPPDVMVMDADAMTFDADSGFVGADAGQNDAAPFDGGLFNYPPSNVGGALIPSTAVLNVMPGCQITTVSMMATPFLTSQCVVSGTVGYSLADGAPVMHLGALNVPANATLRIRGDAPLILIVYGDAQISGVIDTSAQGPDPGPGADDSNCAARGNGSPGQLSNGVGGGGGGGGFGSIGGPGGNGWGGGMAGNGGLHLLPPRELSPLRGGCSGGGGAISSDGGGGGGALQISAADILDLEGDIYAGGGGGSGGVPRGGGGGGGSGGGVLLEAERLRLASSSLVDTAGGGGGGGGSATNAGIAGLDGAFGGLGGIGGSTGGNGGDRSSPSGVGGGPGMTVDSGGGGGGGAAGLIVLFGRSQCTDDGLLDGIDVDRSGLSNACN